MPDDAGQGVEYFEEELLPGAEQTDRTRFQIEELLYRGRTDFQRVDIFRHCDFGTILALDGVVQLSEADEAIYHEMLVHPPMLSHPDPRRVLIIGGGDGGSARECLKYDLEELVQVEIDPQVIELCRRYVPCTAGSAFDDARLTVVHGDGAHFIRDRAAHYDAIIVDSADEVGPAAVLYTEAFYRDVSRALRPGGVAAFQIGTLTEMAFVRRVARRLAAVFSYVATYRLTIPVYCDGEYCFMAASQSTDLQDIPEELLLRRLRKVRGAAELTYYTPAMHRASQVMPPRYDVGLSRRGGDG